jgi:hypothetical protein
MVRRCFLLILALACALAPVSAAWALPAEEAESCCCAAKCPCTPTDCAPAPAARASASAPLVAAAVQTVAVRKCARPDRGAFLDFLLPAAIGRATLARVADRQRPAPAATAALFRAHCSWLI